MNDPKYEANILPALLNGKKNVKQLMNIQNVNCLFNELDKIIFKLLKNKRKIIKIKFKKFTKPEFKSISK